MRTDKLDVRDTDRSPIATGASSAWLRCRSTCTPNRSVEPGVDARQSAVHGDPRRRSGRAERRGRRSDSGKAWFEGVSIDEVASPAVGPKKISVRTLDPPIALRAATDLFPHRGRAVRARLSARLSAGAEIERYIDAAPRPLDANRSKAWNNGRTVANALFLRGFDKEILTEDEGHRRGRGGGRREGQGRAIDLVDIVALNTITELGELRALAMTPTASKVWPVPPRYDASRTECRVTDRCSAFAATGKATRDGKMVIATSRSGR